jgi:stage II sporulation protein M
MKKKKEMPKKALSLKTQFKEAWSYIGESKHYIFISIILFLFGALIGVIFKESLSPTINEILKDLLDKTSGLDLFEMIFFILQNNLQSAFLSILAGILMGIFPIVSDITNGIILGYVLSKASEVSGFTSWWRILPHGIFELPAIFISFGLGIKLGFSFFINKKFRSEEFKRRFYNSANVFLVVIIPLLIIAAIIEGILINFIS